MRKTVADVMVTRVVSVTLDATYKEIVQTLVERGISAVPVVDESTRVRGVVSEEDLLHKEEFKAVGEEGEYWPPLRARLRSRLVGGGVLVERADEKAIATKAAELMTSPALTIGPDSSVVEAVRLMERRGVKRLPVVDGDRVLIGIVSRRDILGVFLQSDEAILAAVQSEIDFLTRTVEGVEVSGTVEDGAVTLTGRVHTRSTAITLARLIDRIEGVVSLDTAVGWRVDDLIPPPYGAL